MGFLNNLSGAFGFGGGGAAASALQGALATSATGNTTPASGLQPGNGWAYHTFISPGTFTVSRQGIAQIMVIGGGGGGSGHAASGGGGAGGLIYNRRITLPTGTYNVTVGNGGGVGPNHSISYSGEASSFSHPSNGINLTGNGGGRAGAYSAGTPGGSGGGASGYPAPLAWGDATLGSSPADGFRMGNPGGNRKSDFSPQTAYHAGGGGGGAGSRGQDAPSNTLGGRAGDGIYLTQFTGGSIGIPAIAPLGGGFAGGGGAGAWSGENGGPGAGEGGASGKISFDNNPAASGTDYTGGGGGGGNGSSSAGGGGGKGLVVIRYPVDNSGVTISGSGGSSSSPIRNSKGLPGTSGTYWVQTQSMGSAIQLYIDSTTNGGPWIRVWLSATDNYDSDFYDWSDTNIQGLICDSQKFMYCFVNTTNNVTSNAWAWWFTGGNNNTNAGAFIGTPPMQHGDYGRPLLTQVDATRLADNTNYNGYWLRTGVSSFGSWCDDGRSGRYGQICLKNSTSSAAGSGNSPGGLSDFPHYSGFATAGGDLCSDSNQSYSTTACSSSKRFAIYVKLTTET